MLRFCFTFVSFPTLFCASIDFERQAGSGGAVARRLAGSAEERPRGRLVTLRVGDRGSYNPRNVRDAPRDSQHGCFVRDAGTHARSIGHSESTTAQEQCATSARWTKPRGRPSPRGGASTSNGALLRGRCSVASDVSVVVHRGGPYDAARTAQRLTISQ